MKKIIILFVSIALIKNAKTQSIAINTDGSQPNASAMLDVKNANRGLLIPRVNLTSETDVTTIPSPAFSLLIFNTNSALPEGAGFYFWNGNNKWSKLATLSALNNASWGLSGNSAINPNNDFIGTTDNQPLVFKTNNILSGKIDPDIYNTFFGQGAGLAITSGTENSFFGHNAGLSTTTGTYNTAVGYQSLYSNSIGFSNSANGYQSLYSNTTGHSNTSQGKFSLFANTTGNDNTANGYHSLYSNTTGYSNNTFGAESLVSNTTGSNNTANGYQSLFKNTTGKDNTSQGNYSLNSNTTGNYNTAQGFASLYSNTTGNNNTAYGNGALKINNSGSKNTALGDSADVATNNLSNATTIGSKAIVSTSNTMSFGDGNVDRWAFGLSTTSLQHALEVGTNGTNGNGAFLTQGGTWTNTSSRIKKEDFSDINGAELLQKIMQLPIQQWKYKGTNEYHIGPVAEDFYELFGLGTDDKGISTVDPSGIALAAIKEQQKIINEQTELMKSLLRQNEALIKRIEILEKK